MKIAGLTVVLMLSLDFGRAASAQQGSASPEEELLDSILAVHEFKEVALSPDGRWVAWVETLRPNAASTVLK